MSCQNGGKTIVIGSLRGFSGRGRAGILEEICAHRPIGIAFNRVKQKTKPIDVPASPDAIAESLRRLFEALHANPNSSSQSTMKRILGFVVERRPSTIADAGRGVFVAEGKVSRGAVASLYPGTLYEPDEPVLFPSIGNAFVLRCVDGLLVDGKDRGISRRIYL